MEEHGTSHLGNCMDVLLSDAILMVSHNTAEVNFLFQGGDVIFKGLGCKYPIISSLTLKVPPPCFFSPPFECVLHLECISCPQRFLVSSKDNGLP
jgi:hypothetical protein